MLTSQPNSLNKNYFTAYSCHGRWKENETNYLITSPITRASHGARRFCFIYKEAGTDLVLFSTSPDSCDRNVRPGSTGELVFNVTGIGKNFIICKVEAANEYTLLTKCFLLVDVMRNHWHFYTWSTEIWISIEFWMSACNIMYAAYPTGLFYF